MVRAEQQRAAAVIQRHYGAKGGGGAKGGAEAPKKGRRGTVGASTPHGTPVRGAGAPPALCDIPRGGRRAEPATARDSP